MAEPHSSCATLSEEQFVQVMLLADGELVGAERQQAEALVRDNAQARGLLDELQQHKAAFRAQVFDAPPPVDIEKMVDNVLRQTVARADVARAPVAVPEGNLWSELLGWLRGGVGKLALASGAVAAVGVWLVVSAGSGPVGEPASQPVDVAAALPPVAVASAQGDGAAGALPAPLGEIEELEVESGSVLVSPADDSGATVIWHFAEGQQG